MNKEQKEQLAGEALEAKAAAKAEAKEKKENPNMINKTGNVNFTEA